jgi:hypothetical protein
MREFVVWLYCCIIIHNMLARLGNQWTKNLEESSSPNLREAVFTSNPNEAAETFRDRLTQKCAAFNYNKGVIPA